MKTITALLTVGVMLLSAVPASPAGQGGKVKLTQTNFPDGTGSIGLAPGWHLEGAYRGGVHAKGPNETNVVMKLPWVIMRPESSVAQLPASAQQPMARAGDIPGALREVLKKKSGGTLKSLRGRKLGGGGGIPAYLLFYEYTYNGRLYSAMGYFAVLDYGSDQPFWQLYSSAVVAPKTEFAKAFPTMMAIWKSWRPNGEEPKEGSASQIFDKALAQHKASYERIQQEFREQL
jgi:hypothetical protein